MSTAHLKKLEQCQHEKGQDACDEFVRRGYPAARDIIQDLVGDKLGNILYGATPSLVLTGTTKLPLVPNFVPFYEKVFITICAYCSVVNTPSDLEPFLKAECVIPVLISPLPGFPPEFIEAITPFLHLPFSLREALHWIRLFCHEEATINTHVCSNCFGNSLGRALASIKGLSIGEADMVRWTHGILPYILTPSALHMMTLQAFNGALESEGSHALPRYASIIGGIGKLDQAIVYSSVCALEASTVDTVIKRHNAYFPADKVAIMSPDLVRESALRLGIAYSPDIDVGDYLKIVQAHAAKCVGILSTRGLGESQFQDTLDRVNDISAEVRKLAGTKRGKVFEFTTSFLRENKGLLAPLVGGGVGFIAGGLAGCGVGGGLGSVISYLSKKGVRPKVTEECRARLEFYLRPLSLKLLAKYYGTSLETVQIWDLRRRISRLRRAPSAKS